MRILHYTLGLPPYRSGGLTKYSIDLAKEQSKTNKVFILFPGKMITKKSLKIKLYKKFLGMDVFEIINPLPVPLLGGISNINEYTKKMDFKDEYLQFLNSVKPDLIHIHTLMGMPIEFIKMAKKLNIKILFTTHDYFGLCPKVNFIDYCGKLCDGNLEKCCECNKNAYSMKMIYIMQSSIYRRFKENIFVSKFRNKKKLNLNKENKIINENKVSKYEIEKYNKLRKYYIDILNNIDYIHFNSYISKSVYERFGEFNGDVIEITHSNIRDNRKIKNFDNEELKILFLGSVEKYKGLPMLIESLKEIKGKFTLDVYGNKSKIDTSELNNRIKFNGKYNNNNLKDIIKKYDLLVVPSIWYETFGFILLEGLSNAIPIITSNTVGSSYLIHNDKTGYVINPNKNEFVKKINYLIKNKNKLKEFNKNICEEKFYFSMEQHSEKILKLYKKLLKK
ncbi:glycosyltransferase [Clostridium baratii]|uniref:glycosyltransferase n=1 Tax=Clostridium baratii TaxID=1561 RepID=UPI0028FEA9A7|nr:glycosyltransferase [Clostridium baratii]MDU1055303.1 glycosyltransferase [Clostridium baratii]